MNFIKKVFDEQIDNSVHLQFQKFSRGEFKNKACMKVKKSGSKFSINTSPEFANELVMIMAQKLGEDLTHVTGAIVSTSDLKDKIDFKEIKQFQGVKRYLIDKEMSGKEILSLTEEFPKTFFALTFNANEQNKLKIKPKAPKSGKPKNKSDEEQEIVADFCRLITDDQEIADSFIFETSDFKKAEFAHTFIIEKIIIPDYLKEEKDFAKIREGSLREGKILREGSIDDKKVKSEKYFQA